MGKDMKGKNLGGGISQRKDISVLQGLPAKAVRGLKSILKRLRMPKNGLRNQNTKMSMAMLARLHK